MEHLASLTSVGNDAVHNRRLRKRKEYPKQVTSQDMPVFDYKRRREDNRHASIWPLSQGTVIKPCHVAIGVGEKKIHSSNVQFGGQSRRVSPNALEGQQAKVEGNYCSGEVTRDASNDSGLGNTSTVTTSSNGDGQSRLVQSSGKMPKVSSKPNIADLGSSAHTISIGRHTTKRQRGVRHRVSHTAKERLKLRTHDHGDVEVLSPPSNSLTGLASHEIQLDRLFQPRLQDVGDGNVSEKVETTCIVDSGCTSVEAGKRDRDRDAPDYSCLKHQHDGSCEDGNSTWSRPELQGSSVVTDLGVSSCSDSILSGLRTSFKRYRSKGLSFNRELIGTPSGRKSSSPNETLANNDSYVAVEYMARRSEEMLESSSAVSTPAGSSSDVKQQEQENSSSSMDNKSSSDDAHPQGNDSLEQASAPTFVLSSGRLSQEQEKKLGMRPSTIDDDFDRYFAQLML